MTDVLGLVHVGSSVVALIVTGLMGLGFVRLAWTARGLIGHLAQGVVMVHAAVFLRTLYRDILPLAVAPEVLFARPAFLTVSLVLNALIVLAGWHGLRALHLAIPDAVRGRYSLLTAALYPPLRRR